VLCLINVALSVSLTAISSILAFVALPVVLAATFPTIAAVRELEIPVTELTYRLFLLLLLPVGTGMLLRRLLPKLLIGHERRLRVLSLILVVLLLALIVIHQWEAAQRLFFDAAVLATLFSGFAALAGWATGLLLRLDRPDRYVFAVEFAIRNVGVAAVVGATSLGRPEFVTFGALFVVAQFPLVALLLYIHNRGRSPRSSATVDTT
jgi:bile acid:Na+ symporter, BASS family